MRDREVFLRTYYLSVFLSETITSFLMVPVTEYDRALKLQQYHLFVEGAAGVTADLLRGENEEIGGGVRLLQQGLRRGCRFCICADPLEYYRKLKAIGAICRPYFYFAGDKALTAAMEAELGLEPGWSRALPDQFDRGLMPYWLCDTLTMCDYFPERFQGREGRDWVRESFLYGTTPQWDLLEGLDHGTYIGSFLYDTGGLTPPVESELVRRLEAEAAALVPCRDRGDYFTLFYGKHQ